MNAAKPVHEVDPGRMEELAEVAFGPGLKAAKAFLAYQGNDARYREQAKVGISLLSGYSRLYSGQAHNRAVTLMAGRQKALPAGETE